MKLNRALAVAATILLLSAGLRCESKLESLLHTQFLVKDYVCRENEMLFFPRDGHPFNELGDFSFGGWVQVKTSKDLRLFSILDKKERTQQRHLNSCPLSSDFLLKNPSYFALSVIKKNPNCVLSLNPNPANATQTITLFSVELDLNPDTPTNAVDQPISSVNKSGIIVTVLDGKKSFNMTVPKIQQGDWLFINVAFSESRERAAIYCRLFGKTATDWRNEFEFKGAPFKIHDDFVVSANQNINHRSADFPTLAVLKSLNFYQFYTDNPLELSFVDSPVAATNGTHITEVIEPKTDRKTSEFYFSKALDTNITSNSTKTARFSFDTELLNTIVGSAVVQISVNLETNFNFTDIFLGRMVSAAPSFKMDLFLERRVKMNAEFLAIRADVVNKEAPFSVRSNIPGIEALESPVFVSLNFLPQNFAQIVLSTEQGRSHYSPSIRLPKSAVYFETPQEIDRNLKEYLALPHSSYTAQFVSGIKKISSNLAGSDVCGASDEFGCYFCAKGILELSSKTCISFCPNGFIAIADACTPIPPSALDLADITPGQPKITPFMTTVIRPFNRVDMEFNQPISVIFDKNATDRIKITELTTGANIPFQIISAQLTSLEVELRPENSILFPQLSIKVQLDLSLTDQPVPFDSDFEFRLPVLNQIPTKTNSFVALSSNIVVVIILSYALMGAGLCIVGYKACKNEFITKKIVMIVQWYQLLSLLPFVAGPIPLPFLMMLEKLVVYPNAIAFIVYDKLLPNFAFSPNFLLINFRQEILIQSMAKHFFVCLVLQLVIFLAYIAVHVITRYRDSFKSQTKENLVGIIEFFEFNGIILTVSALGVPALAFCGLFYAGVLPGLKSCVVVHMVVAVYLFILLALAILYKLEYSRRHSFLEINFNKIRFSHLFIGYRNSKESNIYELARFMLMLVIAGIMTGLNESPLIQFVLLSVFLGAFIGVTSWMKPFEKAGDQVCDALLQGALAGPVVLLAFVWFGQDWDWFFGWPLRWSTNALILYILGTFVASICRDFISFLRSIRYARYSTNQIVFDARLSTSSSDHDASLELNDQGYVRKSPGKTERRATQSFGRLGTLGSRVNFGESTNFNNVHTIEIVHHPTLDRRLTEQPSAAYSKRSME